MSSNGSRIIGQSIFGLPNIWELAFSFDNVSSREGIAQDGEIGDRVKIRRWNGFAGQRELNLLGWTGLEDSVEEGGIESLPASQLLISRSKKTEAEQRAGFQFGKKLRRKELLRFGNRHVDERAPTHAQKILQGIASVGQEFHTVRNILAEIEKLLDEAIQGLALRGCKGKKRD